MVAHNGIIENFMALRRQLIEEGHKFLSETDSEVLAHLIEKYYKGETLPISINKGPVMLRYDSINITITNSDSKMIKNSLPKGLRKAINK